MAKARSNAAGAAAAVAAVAAKTARWTALRKVRVTKPRRRAWQQRTQVLALIRTL